MILVILVLSMILLMTLWFQRIQRLALLLWMTEKDMPLPSETDMSWLIKKVMANQRKDITGGWSRHS